MRKTVSLLLAIAMLGSIVFSQTFISSATTCTHQHVEMEVITEATVRSSGQARIKCSDCGYYKAKGSSGVLLWVSSATNRNVVKYNYYKPFTLSYKATKDGAVTGLSGEYRVTTTSKDLYTEGFGEAEPHSSYPQVPATPVPTGYEVAPYESNKYEVISNGTTYSYIPGASIQMVPSFANDIDSNYVILPMYVIAEPEVTVEQNAKKLTATIENQNKNLSYSYQWKKGSTVLTGETGPELTLNTLQDGENYSVAVTVKNGENSVIELVNKHSSYSVNGSVDIQVDGKATITFDSNGGLVVPSLEKDIDETFGNNLPSAGYVDGLQNQGWYLKNEDGTVSDNAAGRQTKVEGDCTLFQKRAIKAPQVKIERSRNPYNYTGETLDLTAKVTEYAPVAYSYQWYKNGEIIEGATRKTLTLDGVVADSGTYSVKVTSVLADEYKDKLSTTNDSASSTATDQALTIRRTNNQLIYDLNGGIGESQQNNFDYIQNGKYIAEVEGMYPTKEGFVCAGWNTQPDGSGDNYLSDGTQYYEFSDESGNGGQRITLYANWKADVNGNGEADETETKYTISYEDGVGEAAFASQVYENNLSGMATPKFDGIPIRKGYRFLGWTSEPSETVQGNAVYTAQWEKIETTPTKPVKPTKPTVTPDETVQDTPKDTSTSPSTEEAKVVSTVSSKDTTKTVWNENGNLPKTGDSDSLLLWFSILCIACGGGCTLISNRKRKTSK